MRPLRNHSAVLSDVLLLVARVAVGVVFVAHGWQKFTDFGIAGTTQAFEGMGIPAPAITAPLAAAVELGGGVLLILGVLTPIAGAVLALQMLGAAVFVHFENGVFTADNGWELVGALAMAALVLAVVGPGRISLDGVLVKEPLTA